MVAGGIILTMCLVCGFSPVRVMCHLSLGREGVVMRLSPLLVLPLLWSLTLSQHTVPYVSFFGWTLANHSYMDISRVGTGSNGVQCHTDLSKCCAAAQGRHRGDWYFPNGTRLPILSSSSGNIVEVRTAQKVDIRRHKKAEGPTGIYRCDVPTNADHHDNDTSVRVSVYVGLYTSTGGIMQESHTFINIHCRRHLNVWGYGTDSKL